MNASTCTGDTETLKWALGFLKDSIGTISGMESCPSCTWSALCKLFEFLTVELHCAGMDDLAEDAVKSMALEFTDFLGGSAPVSVRNIILFRRAVLFLCIGGDRDQAEDDLESIVESALEHEDNGPFTMIRVAWSEILLHWCDRDKTHRTNILSILRLLAGNSNNWTDDDTVTRLANAYLLEFTSNRYSLKDALSDLAKAGIGLYIDHLEGRFHPSMLWFSGVQHYV